jgi:hypothetical protein
MSNSTFAIKIRKSELNLIDLLAGGLYDHPNITEADAGKYLVVTPQPNHGKPEVKLVTEKEFDAEYANKVSSAGPELLKINKRASS